MLATVPDIAEIGVDALERKLPDALVLDVREPEEYARGHVPGAINVPQAELASRLDELPRGRAILTICQSGARSLRAAQFLKQMGFDQVASVKGGTKAWLEAGKQLAFGDISGVEKPRLKESKWAHAGVF